MEKKIAQRIYLLDRKNISLQGQKFVIRSEMRTSDKGVELIKKFEGLRLKAYKCSAGVWTIGYGHTKGVKQGQKITEAEAEALLKQDLTTFENGVNSLKLSITQNQFDALVSFAFNLGINALRGSTLLKKVRLNPNDTTIRNEFMRWVYAGGTRLSGLEKRRKAESDLYFYSEKGGD